MGQRPYEGHSPVAFTERPARRSLASHPAAEPRQEIFRGPRRRPCAEPRPKDLAQSRGPKTLRRAAAQRPCAEPRPKDLAQSRGPKTLRRAAAQRPCAGPRPKDLAQSRGPKTLRRAAAQRPCAEPRPKDLAQSRGDDLRRACEKPLWAESVRELSLRVLQVDGAGFGVEVQSLGALLAHAVARFFRAAEGELILDTCGGQVHGDQSGFDAVDEAVNARQILRH